MKLHAGLLQTVDHEKISEYITIIYLEVELLGHRFFSLYAAASLIFLVPLPAISSDQSQWSSGVEYVFFTDGSCTNTSTRICLTREQYKDICSHVQGMGVDVPGIATYIEAPEFRALAKSGNAYYFSTQWETSVKGEQQCYVTIHFQGVANGQSIDQRRSYPVKSIVKSKETGRVLVRHASQL